jgi:Zn-dependent peptidase ImmA (M78 family)
MTTKRHDNPLAHLRALVPERPLTYPEALWIAERQATSLLEWWDITEPPVPIEVITEIPHLRTSEQGTIPVHASSHWTGAHWQLVVARDDHPYAQRHSLAHELKHILDHPYRAFLYSYLPMGIRPAPVERVADHFATSLLMPKRLVRAAYTGGLQDIQALARHLGVSQPAVRRRLDQLGLTPHQSRGYDDHFYQQPRP